MRHRLPTARHLPRHLVVVALLALVLVGAGATPAAAHASLVGSSPADGDELAEPPTEVTLDFSEGVSAELGGVRVLDASGQRVDLGAVDQPSDRRLVTKLAGDLADGTYLVSYRVISADGHPVTGAVVFAVGSALDEAAVADLGGDRGDRAAEGVGVVARAMLYGGALLAAGLVVFLALVHDGAPDRRRLVPVARIAAVTAAVGAWLFVLSQGALATGLPLVDVLDAEVLRAVVRQGSLGWSVALLLVGLAGLVVVVGRPPSTATTALGLGLATATVASFALFGHTTTAEPGLGVLVADAVHVGVAAVWFGGLVGLGLTLHRRRRLADVAPGPAPAPVPIGDTALLERARVEEAVDLPAPVADTLGIVLRFSTLAAVAVFVLWLSGGVLTWSLVGGLDELVDSSFGRVLLVKLGIVVVVVALAAWNRYRLVPALLAADADPDDDPGGDAADPTAADPTTAGPGADAPTPPADDEPARWDALTRTVRREAALLAVVVLVTAVLVDLTPPAETGGPGVVSSAVAVTSAIELDVTVVPAVAGRNTVHLTYVEAGTGRPVDPVSEATVELRLPALDVGPIIETPPKAGPGHYILVTDALAVAGTWEVTIRSRLDRFTEERSTVQVPVVDG